MIDHIVFPVTDIERSKAFYDHVLGAIGLTLIYDLSPQVAESGTRVLGYGEPGEEPCFWLDGNGTTGKGLHAAFRVENRALVHDFHETALAAGGTDHGAPGLRDHYAPNYYAAFILDPDGINVEAVCHGPAD